MVCDANITIRKKRAWPFIAFLSLVALYSDSEPQILKADVVLQYLVHHNRN